MVGLLSLPDELLEAVGTQVIGCDKAGLREWCRVTSTCKQLWDMQLPGSASQWSMDLEGDIEGAPWIMQRVRSTRELSVTRDDKPLMELELDVLRRNVKALIRASQSFDKLTTLGLDIHEELVWKDDSMRGEYFQQWLSALLLSTQRLASLSVRTDGVPWSPVLGRLSVRHLELTMREVKPWLHVIMADLSLCSSLETLTIEDDLIDHDTISKGLPDVFLHDVTTLKTVEFVGWYPEKEFTLPPGCMLHLVVIMESQAQWHGWQEKGSTSMLYLVSMKLETWPAGIQDLSGLRYLELYCKSLQDQDLADLQHIPYVSLVLEEFSTFLVTNGSWQSLKISGYAGFNVRVSNVDAFVRDTQRFLFESTSQEAAGMYKELRAACMRQGVACHECDHVHWYEKAPAGTRNATLSNLKLCRASERVTTYGSHESFICIDPSSRVFPHRATYPELYC